MGRPDRMVGGYRRSSGMAAGPIAGARGWNRRSRASALLALLLDLVERLGEALERVLVGRGGAATGGALHRPVGALAHGVDHARLLGDVLDPGAVVLRVHRELGGADLGGGVGAGLERIADDHRNLVLHVLRRPGGDEDVGGVALAAGGVWLSPLLRWGRRTPPLRAAARRGRH